MAKIRIKGGKGGSSSSRTPTEQPDDLQSVAKAKILIALAEGEIAGGLTGKNIFLDGTPLENSDGSSNFSGVAWEFREGTQAQRYIQGIPSAENEISVGMEISSDTAWTHTFTNPQLSGARVRLKWPSLFKQQDNGDLVGYSIKYAIDLQTDGGTWKTIIDTSVIGKTTSGYERSHRINFPQLGNTWTVRLRKITGDANSAKIGDTMTLQSYTEVIDAKLRYPNTALLYIEFDSSQFNGSIPQISCEPRGRIIRVPDNYDPESRTYTGIWQGQFKWAWTDNPAWIFYDVVINDRFGLGDRLTAENISKWTLYEVAQYCDQMVPDGRGGDGTEPRHICNVYVQDRNDAYTVLRDFAAIFRGMTYWGGNQIVALADMPRDVDYVYTNASAVDGLFTYASSTSKTRYTSSLVSYSDPANAYADAVEPVFDQTLVARYKVYNPLEVTAIGCTRQSEAQRKGRWGILTNNKDRIVTFGVGLDGNIPQPGYVIAVADEFLSGRVAGGRISSVNGRVIELDRKPDAIAGDRLMLNLPSGAAQSRTIQAINGNFVTVTVAYSEVPEAESVWVVESEKLYAQQYRVVGVADNNDGTFTICAAQHDPDKYARIDTGAIIDDRPVSVIPPGNQIAPDNIIIDSYSTVNQGISVETLRAYWDAVANAISYEAQWRRDEGNWINIPRSSTTSFEIPSIYSGRYLVRVRAINAAEISSGWAYSQETTLIGKVGKPPQPVSFKTDPLVFGIQLSWNFPEGAEDTLKTEIQYNDKNAEDGAMLLSDIPYPQRSYQQMGLKAGQSFFYRARLVDKTGNQGDWIEWVLGESSTDVDWIADEVKKGIEESEVFKELNENVVDANKKLEEIAGDSISNSTASIINSLTIDADSKRWRKENGDRKAEITVTREAIATETEARATQVIELKTETEKTNASLAKLSQTVSDNESSTATDITNLNAKTDKTDASLSSLSQTVADGDKALSQQITQLNSKTDTTNSNITELSKTVAEGDKALSEKVTALTTTVNGNTAAIKVRGQTIFDQNGVGSAVYSIGTGITYKDKYYAAGLSVGAEVNAAGAVSTRILASADQFAVLNPATNGYTLPFFIQGSQTFIVSALIQDASITNAKIGSYIQSNNYVAGQAGWRIDKNGVLEMNSALPGGGRSVFDSNGMAVYDQNGVKRFAAGYKP